MRRAGATVRRQDRRHLGNRQPLNGRLHHHFAGEFHAGCLQIQPQNRVAVETPQPAMEIAARAMEEQPSDRGQHRIAQIAVQRRHRTRHDAALEAVPHHQRITLPQLRDE